MSIKKHLNYFIFSSVIIFLLLVFSTSFCLYRYALYTKEINTLNNEVYIFIKYFNSAIKGEKTPLFEYFNSKEAKDFALRVSSSNSYKEKGRLFLEYLSLYERNLNKLINKRNAIIYRMIIVDMSLVSVLFVLIILSIIFIHDKVYSPVKNLNNILENFLEDPSNFNTIEYDIKNEMRSLINSVNKILNENRSFLLERNGLLNKIADLKRENNLLSEELKETKEELYSLRAGFLAYEEKWESSCKSLRASLKLKEDNINEQKKLFYILANLKNDSIVIKTNKKEEIVFASNSIKECLTKRNMFGRNIRNIFGLREDWDNILGLLKEKGEIEKEIHIKFEDNSTILPYLIRATTVYDEHAEVKGYLFLFEPLYNREYVNDKIRRIQKIESLRITLAGLFHDLNNIFSIIKISAGLISRKEKIKNREYLDNIESSITKATSMATSLMNFLKDKDTSNVSLNINSIIEEVISLVNSSLKNGITIEKTLDKELPLIEINKEKMGQVLLNLIINANDAINPPGKIIIGTRKIIRSSDGKEYVEITVADTGSGIPEEIRDEIFKPFFSTKGREDRGVGLAVVKSVIMEYDGEISFQTSDKGTTFIIKLPVEKSSTTKFEEESDRQDETVTDIMGKNEKIVIIEDEDELRKMLKDMIEMYNYEVITFSSSQEALPYIRELKEEIGVIILDIKMSGMTGLDLLKIIREEGIKTPVIVSTGYVSRTEKKQLYKLGISGFLMKPYKSEKILGKIRFILDS